MTLGLWYMESRFTGPDETKHFYRISKIFFAQSLYNVLLYALLDSNKTVTFIILKRKHNKYFEKKNIYEKIVESITFYGAEM